MLKEKDFVWHEKKVNNIDCNPLHAYYCIVDFGEGEGRLYSIEMQYPQDERGLVLSDIPEFYILYESRCYKTERKDHANYGEYLLNDKVLVRVFNNLEDAKRRAFLQYSHIYHGVIPTYTGLKPKGHFVVK